MGSSCMTSRLCHVWLCDVASPIPSWHRLRSSAGRCDVRRLAVIVLLIYCTVLYLDFARWSILDVVDSRRLVNVVTCIISCIGSGIFWNGFFEMPEEYIMVERTCG